MMHRDKLNIIAFDLFREWTKNASFDYPNNDFTIIDETALVNDLISAVEGATVSLVKEEKAVKRNIFGYDYGFIIGYIQGDLNVHWHNEYIVKASDLYKGFAVNKALFEYLKFDSLTEIRINALYKHFLKDGLNLQSVDFDIPLKEEKKYGIDIIEIERNYNSKDNPILTYLENSIQEQVVQTLDSSSSDYLQNLESFFKRKLIEDLIEEQERNNHKQF